MSNKINKTKVGNILEKFGKEVKKMDQDLYCDGDSICLDKLNKLSITKNVVSNLQKLGVESSDDLRTMGFTIGYMLLRF
jgi:hypothetical protein